jgi:tetratricopeptide (TPR) repeat protein
VELKLKVISQGGIDAAISKAEVYRYLNEPGEAESICRDVLAVEPDNQAALRLLGLAITDQFTGAASDRHVEVKSIFQRLTGRYEQLYYTGLLHERRAKAQLRAGQSPYALRVLFEEAMRYFEEAEQIKPAGNDDAILRWNRCARLLQSRPSAEWRKELEPLDAGDSPPI